MLSFLTVKLVLSQLSILGVPVGPSRLHVKDWIPLEEKNKKKASRLEGEISFNCWENHHD